AAQGGLVGTVFSVEGGHAAIADRKASVEGDVVAPAPVLTVLGLAAGAGAFALFRRAESQVRDGDGGSGVAGRVALGGPHGWLLVCGLPPHSTRCAAVLSTSSTQSCRRTAASRGKKPSRVPAPAAPLPTRSRQPLPAAPQRPADSARRDFPCRLAFL